MAGIKESIGKTTKKIKDVLFGENGPSIEYYPQKKKPDKSFENYIWEEYERCDNVMKQKLPRWISNRKAYLGDTYDRYDGWGTEFDANSTPNSYTSDIVADKINDIIAFHMGDGMKIYPMPDIDEEAPIFIEFVGIMMENGFDPKEAETKAKRYFRKVWEKVFDDIHERRSLYKKDIMILLDAYLCECGITRQSQRFDWIADDENVFVDIVQPEHFLRDIASNSWEEARYCFEKIYMNPYEMQQLFPGMEEEIKGAVIDGNSSGSSGSFVGAGGTMDGGVEPQDKYNGKVLLVVGYFRDDTVEEVEIPVYQEDPETGEQVLVTVEKKKQRVYPSGRRVYFLPDTKVVLKDEDNPYPRFPYAIYEPFPVSWSKFGKNQTTPLSALQLADDQIFQQMLANLKAVGNAWIVYDAGSVPDANKIDNRIAIKIEANNPSDVVVHKAQGITVDSVHAQQAVQANSNRISGIESVAEGRPVGSLQSGTALQTLLQGTSRKIKPRAKLFAEFKREQGEQIGDLALVLYKEGRLLRVSDEDGIPVRLPFSLFEVTKSIDVRVDTDSKFPADPSQLFPFLIQLMSVVGEDGLPLADRQSIVDLIDWPGGREMIERLDEVSQKRQAELAQAQAGRTAPQGNRGMGTPPSQTGIATGG